MKGTYLENNGRYMNRCGETAYVTKDSGARAQFDTGAQRDTECGKGRFDLIPYESLLRLAQLYERGAAKYDDNNWKKGIPISRCLSSASRHLHQYLSGEQTEDHLAAVAWNVFVAMWTEAHKPELQDLETRNGAKRTGDVGIPASPAPGPEGDPPA